MKKLLTIAAVAALAFGVVACKQDAATDENAPAMDQSSAEMKNDMNSEAAPADAAKPAENAETAAASTEAK